MKVGHFECKRLGVHVGSVLEGRPSCIYEVPPIEYKTLDRSGRGATEFGKIVDFLKGYG